MIKRLKRLWKRTASLFVAIKIGQIWINDDRLVVVICGRRDEMVYIKVLGGGPQFWTCPTWLFWNGFYKVVS